MTYSYDPTRIASGDFNQMRFELGDTMITGEGNTTAMCDEEYQALIDNADTLGKGWGFAKFQCLKAIFMRFSYEVDFSVDRMSIELNQRWEHWKWLYEQALKNNLANDTAILAGTVANLNENQLDGGHYFKKNLHRNPPLLYRKEWRKND